MSETNDPELEAIKSDADWAALAAIEALKAGRYALGAVLARTADQARRMALRVPGAGPQLVDQVAQLRHVPLIGSTREEHPARVDQDQTARMQPVPPDSTRCRWVNAGDPPGSECWGVIYVDPQRGWSHLNPEEDKAHPACPIAPGGTL